LTVVLLAGRDVAVGGGGGFEEVVGGEGGEVLLVEGAVAVEVGGIAERAIGAGASRQGALLVAVRPVGVDSCKNAARKAARSALERRPTWSKSRRQTRSGESEMMRLASKGPVKIWVRSAREPPRGQMTWMRSTVVLEPRPKGRRESSVTPTLEPAMRVPSSLILDQWLADAAKLRETLTERVG